MTSDEALDYLKEKYNMYEYKTLKGVRYLFFKPNYPWIVRSSLNKYMLELIDKYDWEWFEYSDGFQLHWSDANSCSVLCEPSVLDPKIDKLYKLHKQLELETKEMKIKQKLKDIEKDF